MYVSFFQLFLFLLCNGPRGLRENHCVIRIFFCCQALIFFYLRILTNHMILVAIHFILCVDQKCFEPCERHKHPYHGLIDNQTVIDGELSINFFRVDGSQGTHSTKTISEVSGTGRKPYPQKGTGRARHGTLRGPQVISCFTYQISGYFFASNVTTLEDDSDKP